MSLQKPEHLVGASATDPNLKEFLSSLDGKTKVDHFAEMKIVEYPDGGAAIYLDRDERVTAIFFYGDVDEDHKYYDGILPKGLSFHDTKADVERKLGSPSASGTEKDTRAPWERFDFENYSAHVKFRPDFLAVNMVTLMSPAMARGET
jgi:hypothetical protein